MGTPSASVLIDIKAREILSSGIKAGVIPASFYENFDLNNGTAVGSCDLWYATTTTAIAASATTQYDLAGTLTDSFGTVITFVEIVLIAIRNKRTTALANITLKPGAATPFGCLAAGKGFWPADIAADNDQGNVVGPEGWVVLYDKEGVPVGAGATDRLDVVTSAVVGATNSWDILIVGRSA